MTVCLSPSGAIFRKVSVLAVCVTRPQTSSGNRRSMRCQIGVSLKVDIGLTASLSLFLSFFVTASLNLILITSCSFFATGIFSIIVAVIPSLIVNDFIGCRLL